MLAFAILASAGRPASAIQVFDNAISTVQRMFHRSCATPKRTGLSEKGLVAVEYEETERQLLQVLARIRAQGGASQADFILAAGPSPDEVVRNFLREKLARLEQHPALNPAAIRVMPSGNRVVDIERLRLVDGVDYQVDSCLDGR